MPVSSGSSSGMFTPAISASSTSFPSVMSRNARSTAHSDPPFLNWMPLASEMTSGRTALRIIASGAACRPAELAIEPGAAAASPTPAVVRTKSRRLIVFRAIETPGRVVSRNVGRSARLRYRTRFRPATLCSRWPCDRCPNGSGSTFALRPRVRPSHSPDRGWSCDLAQGARELTGGSMFAVTRRYTGASALIAAIEQRRSEVERLVTTVPGFVSYYAIRSGDTLTSVTVCEDLAGVNELTRRSAEWVGENLPESGVEPPVSTIGDVLIALSAGVGVAR